MSDTENKMFELVFNYIEGSTGITRDMLDDCAVELIEKYDAPDNTGLHAVVRVVIEEVKYFVFDYNKDEDKWYCEVYTVDDWFEV